MPNVTTKEDWAKRLDAYVRVRRLREAGGKKLSHTREAAHEYDRVLRKLLKHSAGRCEAA